MKSRRDHILDAAVRRSVAARTPPRLRKPAPDFSTVPAGPGSSSQGNRGSGGEGTPQPFLHHPYDDEGVGSDWLLDLLESPFLWWLIAVTVAAVAIAAIWRAWS